MEAKHEATYVFTYEGLTGNELHAFGKALEKHGFQYMDTRENYDDDELYDIRFKTTEESAQHVQQELLEHGIFMAMMWDEE